MIPAPPAVRAPLALAALASILGALTLGAWPARAATARCWIDERVVVVPAVVAGVAGDYILDTGTAVTQLDETRAQAEGFTATSLTAEVRLAGLRMPDRAVAVVNLDVRTFHFPTPIAGVIGADILTGHVLDVSFAPCWVGLWPAGRAPRFRGGMVLPLQMADGRPVIGAAVADGPRAEAGGFVPATGSDAAVRIDADHGLAPGKGAQGDLLPYGPRRARLRALSFAGELWENLPAGLIAGADLPRGALGEIGPAVLARWRLRFDMPAGRLLLAPAAPPPRR